MILERAHQHLDQIAGLAAQKRGLIAAGDGASAPRASQYWNARLDQVGMDGRCRAAIMRQHPVAPARDVRLAISQNPSLGQP
jgi:hypothetical protein